MNEWNETNFFKTIKIVCKNEGDRRLLLAMTYTLVRVYIAYVDIFIREGIIKI